jgi:hypothetical protein
LQQIHREASEQMLMSTSGYDMMNVGRLDSITRRSNHTHVLMQRVTNDNLMRTVMKQQVV